MSSLPEQTASGLVGADVTTAHPLSPASGLGRLYFLDNLRAALTVLVVLHHLAVIYGAVAIFYYVEPPAASDQIAGHVLGVFVLINQAYFMGFFFLISGYFTPASYDRKGPGAFYKDRLLRLGIPLLVFLFILSPISYIGYFAMPVSLTQRTAPFSWSILPATFSVGPLWFAEMLLFFCLGYVIWRLLVPARGEVAERVSRSPGKLAIGLFILLLALASYLIRIVVPLGMEIPVLGFPTLAYLPQYLSFFILGIVAFRRNWFQTIPASLGRLGLVVALVATVVLAPVAFSDGLSGFPGHGTLQSAAYALWDSTFSVGICLALLTFFRHFLHRQNGFARFLSQQAFTVYIIHIPVIVLLAVAMQSLHCEALLKFALAALIGVPLCFALAWLVRKLPGVSSIL